MKSFYPSQIWKHCPYCGSEKIEWTDGTHRMVCSTCNKQFYINAAAAVVAIITNSKGEVLFTKRKHNPAKDMLDLPGGFVNLGEKAEDAVKREIKEELNINISNTQFSETFPNRYLFGGIVYFTLDMVFKCNVDDFSTITANDDISSYVFIAPQNIDIDAIGLESIKVIAKKIKDAFGVEY